MKRILFVIFCGFLFTCADGFGQQVIIGTKTQSVSPSSLLEFPDDDKRGIVLPKVSSTAMVAPVDGTLIFDTVDNKIKYRSNNSWEDMSINEGQANLALQQNLVEVEGARTLVGGNTSSADGVLVLESTTSALVLPRVSEPHVNILSPLAGTIVYDTESKMVCVFNGKEWAFWGVE